MTTQEQKLVSHSIRQALASWPGRHRVRCGSHKLITVVVEDQLVSEARAWLYQSFGGSDVAISVAGWAR